MRKSKAVEAIKDLRREYPHAPKKEIAWHLAALAKTDHELVESLVLIFTDALYDEGAGSDAEDREVR
jgi:hypothetical protein